MSASETWPSPSCHERALVRATVLCACLFATIPLLSQDFKKPRFSEVQESIDAAKANAQRVRTDTNRTEFLNILNDVEAALNSARKSVPNTKRDNVLSKLQKIEPDVRSAMINAALKEQSAHVRKIRSVTIKDSEIEAKEKGIVRKLGQDEKTQKTRFRDRINPLSWFGRNRQYTKVVERPSAPSKSITSKEPKDVMVRVPRLPYIPKPRYPNSVPSGENYKISSPTRVSSPEMSKPKPVRVDKPLVHPGMNNDKNKKHSFIPIERQGSSRRISELSRDGGFRLPRGAETESNSLARKIKKPERKSTRSWDFGPREHQTEFVTPKKPEPKWSTPQRLPVEKDTVSELPKVPETSHKQTDKPDTKPSWFSKFKNPLQRNPSSQKPTRSGIGHSKLSSKKQIVQPVAPLELGENTQVTEESKGPNPPTSENKPNKIVRIKPKPSVGTGTSSSIVVSTLSDTPRKPSSTQKVSGSSAVSGTVVADTRKKQNEKVSPSLGIEIEESPEPPVIEQASRIAAEIREEEARIDDQLEGLDKILSDNADVLKEAQSLLEELEALEKENKSKAVKSQTSNASGFNRPGLRRPQPRKLTPSKSVESKSDAVVVPVDPLEEESSSQELSNEGAPKPQSKWGPQIRRPGMRR